MEKAQRWHKQYAKTNIEGGKCKTSFIGIMVVSSGWKRAPLKSIQLKTVEIGLTKRLWSQEILVQYCMNNVGNTLVRLYRRWLYLKQTATNLLSFPDTCTRVCGVQGVCPESRHQGMSVRAIWPVVRHHDACVQMLYLRSVMMTGRTSDGRCQVLLISWVVLRLVTMGRVWICLPAVLDHAVINMFPSHFCLITVLCLQVSMSCETGCVRVLMTC